jgi:hypothetical protein
LLLDRAKTGELPKFLPDYGPGRIDPFSGKPLKYRRIENGFLIYSFGADRIDDGGVTRQDNPEAKTYDEAIRIH